MEPSVFQYFGGTLQRASDEFLGPVIGLVVPTITGVVSAGVILYVFVVGLLIVLGYVDRPLSAFTAKSLRIIIVTSVALSVDAYGSLVVNSVEGIESLLAASLNISSTTATSIYQVLDQTLGTGLELTVRCFDAASNASWRAFGSIIGWTLAGLIIAVGIVAVTLLGGAVIVVAKFALLLLVSIGPLFIVCLIWPPIARFFDMWIGQVINYCLVGAFIVLVMAFSAVTFTRFVGATSLGTGSSPIVVAIELLLLSLLLCWITYQVQTWAASLSGGMSTSVMTFRHMAVPFRTATGVASAARSMVDPRSTRRDLESGHMATARRMNHLAAGNTMLNPAYRQHVWSQAGKNWGRPRGGRVRNRD